MTLTRREFCQRIGALAVVPSLLVTAGATVPTVEATVPVADVSEELQGPGLYYYLGLRAIVADAIGEVYREMGLVF
jgi:hypothetical protein